MPKSRRCFVTKMNQACREPVRSVLSARDDRVFGLSKADFRRWLKALHIIFASLWGGGSAAVVVIMCLFHPTNAVEMYAKYMSLYYVDLYVVGSGVLGCMVTAYLYGKYTSWGFFKHWWLVVKWVTLIGYIFIGLFFFMPWLDNSIEFAESLPPLQPLGAETVTIKTFHTSLTIIQISVVIFFAFISIKKPWGLRIKA